MIEFNLKQSKVLIVDDVVENIQVAANLLSKQGFQVGAASSGPKALEILENSEFDLVLLDVMMPVMDGYQVCSKLKQNPATKDIPVIFLSARNDSDSLVKGLQLGAVDYIAKPFRESELIARVQNHLELKLARSLLARTARNQREMLHVLSHDLANPLSNILSCLYLVESESVEQNEMLGIIRDSAKSAMSLIDLIRKMQKLEEFQAPLYPVNLSNSVDQSCQMLAERFAAKGIGLSKEVDEQIWVHADPVALVHSVLNNLLTNALKFSNSPSQVSIKSQASQGEVWLILQDQGIGMDATQLQRLFDLAYQTTRPGTEGEEGTGFGMPLVERFMHSFGGSIQVESTPESAGAEHGTRVRLRFKPCPTPTMPDLG